MAITGTNIDLNTAAIASDDGAITFTGAVDLEGGAASVDSDANNDGTDGNIQFTSTIDGGQTLAVDADGGTVAFDGAIGGTTALTSVHGICSFASGCCECNDHWSSGDYRNKH